MAVQSSDGGPEPDVKPVRVKGIAAHQNALKQYSSLGSEVFSRIWGPEWDSVRSARGIKRIDFSGPEWNLETLEGEPERGLLHKSLHREFIEILNISKNQLTDISCLDARKPKGAFEFKALHVLNASRNMLTEFHLRNPSLLEINLSHNELDRMPDFRSLTQLQKLLIAHNRLDGTLEQFASLQKLRVLDVSANKFSWKPTGFKKEIDRLQKGHLEEIRFWPNPFAEGFKEYQFVTVTTLDSLTSLDGFVIDTDLRTQLRRQAITLNVRSIDFTMFDIKVDERRKNSSIQGAQASHEQMDAGPVPTLTEIVSVMSNALDHPTELQQHVHTLDQQVASLWCAHFWDRRQLMEIREINHGKANFRQMRAEEEEKAVNEFLRCS